MLFAFDFALQEARNTRHVLEMDTPATLRMDTQCEEDDAPTLRAFIIPEQPAVAGGADVPVT